MRPCAVDVPQPKGIHQHPVVHRCTGQRFFLSRREGLNSIVEMRHQNAAVFIFHPGEQLRQQHRRVRRPVSVVAAVQPVVRPINGNLQMGIAARSKDHRLLAALIDRPVTHQPHIAVDQVVVGIEGSAPDAVIPLLPRPPIRSEDSPATGSRQPLTRRTQ